MIPLSQEIPMARKGTRSNDTRTKGDNTNIVSIPQALTTLRDEDPAFNKVVTIRNYHRGDMIASPDELAANMYVLMSGKVNLICTNNEGRRLVIGMLKPGAVFGEGALIDSGDPTVFAEAADEASIWMLPASEARNMTIQHPILGWGMLQTYGRRLLQVENSLEDVAYKKLPERLAALLLEFDDDYDGLITGVSHQLLADHLGTYRETISAILRDFKRQGLVQLGYRRIKLLDVETLKEIAGVWEW